MTECYNVNAFCYSLNIFNPTIYERIVESVLGSYFMES